MVQDVETGELVDKTVPGAAAVNQKGKWDHMIGVGLACFIGLLNGSLSGKLAVRDTNTYRPLLHAMHVVRLGTRTEGDVDAPCISDHRTCCLPS